MRYLLTASIAKQLTLMVGSLSVGGKAALGQILDRFEGVEGEFGRRIHEIVLRELRWSCWTSL